MSVRFLSSRVGLAIAGGLLFVACFYLRYSYITPNDYQLRDDGIITLSHAKNWVDYGFIGINPSGPRIEGYSAPLQFFLYAGLYKITGLSYDMYASLQTLICTFLLGAGFITFFEGRYRYCLIATACGALILSTWSSFLEWHGSGMENAVVHVTFLYALLILYSSLRSEQIVLWQAAIPFLATISRLESLYYIAPLLMLFCLYWHAAHKTPEAFYFCAITALLWLGFMAWRYYYFGSLIPNTASAQRIDIMNNIIHWRRSLSYYYASYNIVLQHGAYLLALFLPLALYLPRKKYNAFFASCIFSAMITACFAPFFFGPARLDVARTTTYLAVYTALAVAMIISRAQGWKSLLVSLPLLAAGLSLAFLLHTAQSHSIKWSTQPFDITRQALTDIALKEHIYRPTVANPDLGVMSWHKQFNIVDLGGLGSPILVRVTNQRVMADYLLDFALPDLVESHNNWDCQYFAFFNDARFMERYQPVWVKRFQTPQWCGGKWLQNGIWIRKDMLAASGSVERVLMDNLTRRLSLQPIEEALAACEREGGNCLYVARSAYRFLPEFKRLGMKRQLLSLFEHSDYRNYIYFLLNGDEDATAYKGALDEIAAGGTRR